MNFESSGGLGYQNGYNTLQYFPSPGGYIAPPPHPQDYGLRVPAQFDKVNRQFRQPIYPHDSLEWVARVVRRVY